MNEKRYIAEVISATDTLLSGRVQIYVDHLMHGFLAAHYPWAKQDRAWTSDIPEVGDLVWVRFEQEVYLKQAYYMNKVTLKEYHEHAKTIGSMTGAYPDVHYKYFSNGVAIALNSNQKEFSITNGLAEIYASPAGLLTIKSGTVPVQSTVLGETLKTILTSILTAIEALTVTCAAPSSPSSVPINVATFTALKAQLNTILSTKIKNN